MVDRPFDPHWTVSDETLEARMKAMGVAADSGLERRRNRPAKVQSKFDGAVNAILADLMRAHLTDAALEVGIPKGRSQVQGLVRGKYAKCSFSVRTFLDALNALTEAGFVEISRGYWHDKSGKNSRTARYRLSKLGVEYLRIEGYEAPYLLRAEHDGIRLKDREKKLLEYSDCDFVRSARDRLKEINGELRRHWADLALPDDQIRQGLIVVTGAKASEDSAPFDFSARTLHRVFNNIDWGQGGRFYGGWWQRIPSGMRRHIVIDGKRTVEVDYSGLHAALLFAEAGLEIPTDPYERCLTGKGGKRERKLVKVAFNAMLNATGSGAPREIEGYSSEVTGRSWSDFKAHIASQYPEFEQHFGTGVGMRLQRKDSDLAEAVMLKFSRQRYACLPVHDSFIVHHDLQDELADAMRAVFKEMHGAIGDTDFKLGEAEAAEHQEAYDYLRPDPSSVFCLQGHLGRLESFRDLLRKQNLGD